MKYRVRAITTPMMIGIFLVFSLLVSLATSVWAQDDSPRGVEPEQGHAAGSITLKCQPPYTTELIDESYSISVDFWNVGRNGGYTYKDLLFNMSQPADAYSICSTLAGSQTFSFEGGPSGAIETGTPDFVIHMRMINGSYIELTYNQNFEYSVPAGVGTFNKAERYSNTIVVNLPIQNPEIFSKYSWDGSASAAPPRDSGARFSSISGHVDIIPPGGTEDDPQFAKMDQVLLEGTRIITGENSIVVLTFEDKSTLVMRSDSEIIIPTFDKPQTPLSILGGKIKATFQDILSGEGAKVRTYHSVAGIKGTIFVVEVTQDATLLKVIEGKVTLTSTFSGETAEVTNGESVTASSEGLSEKTTFDPEEEEAEWQDLTAENGEESPQDVASTPKEEEGNNTGLVLGGGVAVAVAVILIIGFVLYRKRTARSP